MNTQTEVSSYQQQAIDFMTSANASMKVKYYGYDTYFAGDTSKRDIYTVTIKAPAGSYTFKFGQSVNGSVNKSIPTEYDVLACMTKYDCGSYEDFCSEFGYAAYNEETGKKNKTTLRTYNAVCKEYENLTRIFTDEQMEALREIQ